MKNPIYINIEVIQATSIEQFKAKNGKARMKMPYWTFSSDGNIIGDFVWYDTDKKKLEAMIAAGELYIQLKYK